MKFNEYWFKPKGFGYGAYPTTWEGWLVIGLYCIYLFGLTYIFLPKNLINFYGFLGIGTMALIIISKRKTEGEWKWNWSKKYKDEVKNGTKT